MINEKTEQLKAAQHESEKQTMANKDNLEQKDAMIKELILMKRLEDTSANREEAAQSEAVVHKIIGMSEEMQKEAISIAKHALKKDYGQHDIAVHICD